MILGNQRLEGLLWLAVSRVGRVCRDLLPAHGNELLDFLGRWFLKCAGRRQTIWPLVGLVTEPTLEGS